MPAPHIVKQAVVRSYARRYGSRVFVETGTYFGDMVDAIKSDFDRVYSIELSEKLHAGACKRFDGDPRVELIRGDSGSVMKSVMMKLTAPALFCWMDTGRRASPRAVSATRPSAKNSMRYCRQQSRRM